MIIQTIIEFTPEASVRTIVTVKDDMGALVDPTSILITIVDPLGVRTSKASATSASHLVDTVKNQFVANDVGKIVYNTTDLTQATITAYNSPSDVTLSSDIMAVGEGYETYCVYEEEIITSGKLGTGIYDHYYNTADNSTKGWWQIEAKVIDGSGVTARKSIANHSFRLK